MTESTAPEPKTATKKESYGRMLWYDKAMVFTAAAIVIVLGPLRAQGGPGGLVLAWFVGGVAGVLAFVIYFYTVRRLWVLLRPEAYHCWECLGCGSEVPKEATECPKCKARFNPEPAPSSEVKS
jgi:hypothetical protein